MAVVGHTSISTRLIKIKIVTCTANTVHMKDVAVITGKITATLK